MCRDIVLVGLNYRTASIDIREKFSLADFCAPENWAIPCSNSVRESLILSTCNRVEVCAVGEKGLKEQILSLWTRAINVSVNEILPYIYFYSNQEAVRHLFSVAASIDSMVLGEPQILGQLKNAYRNSVNSGNSGLILNRLLHNSFSVAKRVRNETAVGNNAVSISYAAAELSKRIFGDMSSHTALLIGAGEMAELAAQHLLQAGIKEIIVVNRTEEKANLLAKKFSGRWTSFEKLIHVLPEADIIISSTGSPEPVLKVRDVQNILKLRKNRPMFFIDIAVPRDIDPAINELDNIYLYDIDDLKEVVEENINSRLMEAEKAKHIIAEEVAKFSIWLENLQYQPIIETLFHRGESIASEEIKKTLKHLRTQDMEDKNALELMAASIIKKLLHEPINYLKFGSAGKNGQNERISLMRKMFNLDGPQDCGKKQKNG